ncbi:exopolysaccharide biosynthesis protein [Gilvimarinus agarilyticus]|uniref:exopolysaccharide biosynthesis protein n=1 Tax=Gilvimarinus sp. 2_MG-2023 TaxID=3062666 RepID=UPI001C0A4214|nr:exopolysaccharide biosynthesis protein [Gilvimarinus sp. 2_MG-2023]MBU2885295.1 exopolysaccharide biosynthesis protein [Gilvimarinus agarilyticus]MDO6570194.1 exopolysaccharide biosynthesis protein [Gilvimarinus sp. 2_MG-2023]
MDAKTEVENLEQVMDRVVKTAEGHNAVTLDLILSAIGQRSYGPVLLLVGLIVLAPLIGDIPGVPTLCAIIVLLFSVQLMLQREHFWLPNWLLNRSVKTSSLIKAVKLSLKPARFVDRLVKPRLTFLIRGFIPTRCVALCSIFIALMMPLMEFIPFSANLAGGVLTCFGLALIARDGVLAVLAFSLMLASASLVFYGIWG